VAKASGSLGVKVTQKFRYFFVFLVVAVNAVDNKRKYLLVFPNLVSKLHQIREPDREFLRKLHQNLW